MGLSYLPANVGAFRVGAAVAALPAVQLEALARRVHADRPCRHTAIVPHDSHRRDSRNAVVKERRIHHCYNGHQQVMQTQLWNNGGTRMGIPFGCSDHCCLASRGSHGAITVFCGSSSLRHMPDLLMGR